MPESVTLLHLSDVQFGRFHRFPENGSEENPLDSLAERIAIDLVELREQHSVRPDLFVLTGDIAEWGRMSEFAAAAKFVRHVAAALDLPAGRIAIIPGNHDVNRKSCEAYFNQREAREAQPVKPYWPKWEFFKAFFDDLYRDVGVTFTEDQPWTLYAYDELKTVIAGFNSTIAESHLPAEHYGWLGEQQMRWFAERLREHERNGWLRIGALHHNVRRGPVADDENLRDAEAFRSIVGGSLNLVLHGHTHDGKSDLLRQNVPIYSTGSAAVLADARPPEVPNQYQVLKIDRDGVTRWARAYIGGSDRCFGGDVRASEKKDAWIVPEPYAFENVSGVFPATPAVRDYSEELPKPRWVEPVRMPSTDDLVARVARVCQLHHGGEVDIRQYRNATDPLPYLSVSVQKGAFTELYVVGVAERAPAIDVLAAFGTTIHARYRSNDPGVRSLLVYGGGEVLAADALKEAHRLGFNVQSWIEYQGLLNLRPLVNAQSSLLQRDPRYPSPLYIPQRYTYSVANEERSGNDALEAATELMTSPEGRFVVVLGEFGTGKSFLLRQLALSLAKLDRPLPIFIEMRTLEKGRTLDELIAQHLVRSGEEDIKLKAFRYMVEQGRVALLFDGFDELVVRVTYERAAEHLETLLQAATGFAKVVVTSRTQFFESDQQVKTILAQKLDIVGGRRIVRLQRFDRPQIEEFLTRLLGSSEEALRRMELLDDVKDLMGLSENPRMLSFIAELDREDLERAKGADGKVTSADLYRVLIERWLKFEIDRIEPRGAAPGLTLAERWNAVNLLARYLWEKTEPTIRLSEVGDQIAATIGKLPHLDPGDVTHQVGSGTLLVRDPDGNFSFVHQSVLEWLVANSAAEELNAGTAPRALATKEMSRLMVDFFIALATPEKARGWAARRGADAGADATEKKNAVAILGRLPKGEATTRLELAGADLRGQDLSGRDLRDSDLTGANLEGVNLSQADLRGAKLTGAQLADANLSFADARDADLTNANLQRVRAISTDFRGARFAGANLRRAKLLEARSDDGFDGADTFGAAIEVDGTLQAIYESGTEAEAMEWSADGLALLVGASGIVRWFDTTSGRELRTYRVGVSSIKALALSDDGSTFFVVSLSMVSAWSAATGESLWFIALRNEPFAARLIDDRKILIVITQAFLVEINTKDGTVAASTALPPFINTRFIAIGETGDDVIFEDETYIFLWRHRSELRTIAQRPHTADAYAANVLPLTLVYAAGELIYRFAGTTWDEVSIPNRLQRLQISPNGDCAIASSDWTIADSNLIVDLVAGKTNVIEPAKVAVFSGDSRLVATNSWGGELVIHDVASAKPIRHLLPPENTILVAQMLDAQTIVTVSRSEVAWWHLVTARPFENLWFSNLAIPVIDAAISADGLNVVSANVGSIEVFTSNGKRTSHEVPLFPSSLAIDNTGLVVYGGFAPLTCLDPWTGKKWSLAHSEGIRPLAAFLPLSHSSDARLLTADAEHAYLWTATGKQVGKIEIADLLGLYPPQIIYANGGVIALLTEGGGMLLRLSGRRLEPIRSISGGTFGAISPDGSWLALSSGRDVTIQSTDKSYDYRPIRTTVSGMATFSPDSRRLALVDRFGRAEIIDVASNAVIATYGLGTDGMVGFRPDGRYKMSGDVGGRFGHSIGLCRFEPGEVPALDAALHLPDYEPLI
ncbi:MAG TPA: pentapeptide repeat-containing protein [Thermoanaerobaculia bacterium]|nr:pentapeptide repeat-containing protein [Thermoanaerobaculia bacterium]